MPPNRREFEAFLLARDLHIAPQMLEGTSLRQFQRWQAYSSAIADYTKIRKG